MTAEDGKFERIASALGLGSVDELMSLDHSTLEERLSRALGHDPEAELEKAHQSVMRERYAHVNGKQVLKKVLPAVPGNATSTIHRMRVELSRPNPPIWRRLEIPSSARLDQLHKVLRAAFGWSRTDVHEYETVFGRYNSLEHNAALPELPGDWGPRENESAVLLAQVIPAKNARKIHYWYYSEPLWRLDFTLEEIAPAEPSVAYPSCTGGRRTAPREGVSLARFRKQQAAGAVNGEPFDAARVTEAIARAIG